MPSTEITRGGGCTSPSSGGATAASPLSSTVSPDRPCMSPIIPAPRRIRCATLWNGDRWGPCLLIDTAGFDDTGEVGLQRIGPNQRTSGSGRAVFLLPSSPDDLRTEREWAACLRDQDTPFVSIINTGSRKSVPAGWITELAKQGFPDVRLLDARNPQSREQLAGAIAALAPAERLGERLLDGWIREDQLVLLLIMPQDKGAPQGRLILPQSQVIRELMAAGSQRSAPHHGGPAHIAPVPRGRRISSSRTRRFLKAVQPFLSARWS